MQDVPNIQIFHDSPLGGFVEFLNEWERMKADLQTLRDKLVETSPPLKKLLYKPESAAELMECSKETVYRLVKKGQLETCDGFCDIRIPRRAIENYINRNSSLKVFRSKNEIKS